MWIKKIVAALAAILVYGSGLFAQTPEEIVNKMSEQMKRADAEGVVMDMIIKMPVIGAITSHNLIRGDKMKSTATVKGKKAVIWSDGTTTWTYDEQAGEITVSPRKQSDDSKKEDSDLKAFESLTDGYDLTLEKETSEAWYILCKKSKSNKDKDDPGKMDLTVSKSTYLPIYMRMKQSVMSVSIEKVSIGVSEKSVTFNPSDYPNAKIVDKR